jgi:hypothetical protein
MYIYLDESFSLRRGKKNQFLIIAGFATQNPKKIAKIYKRIKRHTLPRKFVNLEIKSTNPIADRALKKNFSIIFENSAKFLTLQLADQICGVFYQLLQENQAWFKMIEPKLKKIVTNPLSPYKKE